MKAYTLTVNENQARLLSQALEIVTRIQIGQGMSLLIGCRSKRR